MKIAIYGKEKTDVQQIMQTIKAYTDTAVMGVQLYCFNEAQELFQSMDLQREMDVVFQEIGSDIKKSLSVASAINKNYRECQIVYYSKDLHYATEVYSTVHTYFVLKDEIEKRMDEIFRRILETQNEKHPKIQFSIIGGTKLILSPQDIIYFERSKRITRVVSVYGIYEIRDKLSDIMNTVSQKDFFRCHNSYVIGIAAIREITRTHFVMSNGDSVIISRSYKK